MPNLNRSALRRLSPPPVVETAEYEPDFVAPLPGRDPPLPHPPLALSSAAVSTQDRTEAAEEENDVDGRTHVDQIQGRTVRFEVETHFTPNLTPRRDDASGEFWGDVLSVRFSSSFGLVKDTEGAKG